MKTALMATLAVASASTVLAGAGPARASTFTVLHSFSFTDLGYVPTGDLVLDANGDVFGTTATGSQSGTIFRYAPSTNAFRFLFSFNGSGDGAKPQGSLLLRDGKLYGTAASGGANNAGTVYQLDLASESLTTLHVFGGADDGASPYGGVVLQKGKLFGSALQAGAQNGGTLYALALSNSSLATLYGFDPKAENSPIGKVALDGAGVVYGVNELNGKTATGSIYSYDPTTGMFEILHAFTDKKMGALPFAGVTLFQHALYGTTYRGGAHDSGIVWKYDLVKRVFTNIHSFRKTLDGNQPQSRLLITSGGLLYGTAYGGGAYGYGTVYEMDLRTSKFSVIHSFQGADGEYPEAGLAAGSGGLLYGTTALGGGAGGGGTVYSIAPWASPFIKADSPLATRASRAGARTRVR